MRKRGLSPGKTTATATLLLTWGGLVALGAWHLRQWPRVDASELHAPAHLNPDAARTLGAKWSLNDASAQELAAVAGLGPKRAEALVDRRTRLGGFSDWEQVDTVRGVGPSALKSLQEAAFLGPRKSPGAQSMPQSEK